jgi:uncharacterized protein
MKTIQLIYLFLLLSFFVCAKNQHESLPSYGLLWKITGNGLKTPSYLFGTYHLQGGMQILDSIKGFDTIFNSTDQLVCESKVDFSNSLKPVGESNSGKTNSFYKPWPVADSTYENLLSFAQKKTLDSVISSDKLLTYIKPHNFRPISLLSYIKFSYSKLHKNARVRIVKESKPALDSTRTFMLDLYLQNVANKRHMNIVGLDSVGEIQRIYNSLSSQVPQMSYKTEVDILMNYIKYYSEIDSFKNNTTKNLLSAYLKQDICSLLYTDEYKRIDRNLKNNPILSHLGGEKFFEKLDSLFVDARNKNWLKKIPDIIVEKSCFIAVGGGHLAGENGLINQLRELGFTIVPIQENTTQK